MNLKTSLQWTLIAAVVGFAAPTWADDTSNDKVGGNTNPTYNAGTTANNGPVDPNATKTVPSGKHHRTHKKHGTQAQSADANKTINAGDVTPSK